MRRGAPRRLGRCIGAVGVVLALGWGTVAPADAHDRSVASHVRVTVRHDGQDKARAGLRVDRTHARTVTALNSAEATARCDDCRAVALSFQVVLADRGPAEVAADNAAIAHNEACQRCETVAVAYQFVVVSPARAHVTPTGHARLADVRAELHRLAHGGGTAEDIAAAAGALAAEVADVLATELRTLPRVDREVRTRR
ncbi:MAG TPA: hypothetical protein VFZ77_22040 [Acidimicrobiales bacterium]